MENMQIISRENVQKEKARKALNEALCVMQNPFWNEDEKKVDMTNFLRYFMMLLAISQKVKYISEENAGNIIKLLMASISKRASKNAMSIQNWAYAVTVYLLSFSNRFDAYMALEKIENEADAETFLDVVDNYINKIINSMLEKVKESSDIAKSMEDQEFIDRIKAQRSNVELLKSWKNNTIKLVDFTTSGSSIKMLDCFTVCNNNISKFRIEIGIISKVNVNQVIEYSKQQAVKENVKNTSNLDKLEKQREREVQNAKKEFNDAIAKYRIIELDYTNFYNFKMRERIETLKNNSNLYSSLVENWKLFEENPEDLEVQNPTLYNEYMKLEEDLQEELDSFWSKFDDSETDEILIRQNYEQKLNEIDKKYDQKLRKLEDEIKTFYDKIEVIDSPKNVYDVLFEFAILWLMKEGRLEGYPEVEEKASMKTAFLYIPSERNKMAKVLGIKIGRTFLLDLFLEEAVPNLKIELSDEEIEYIKSLF